MSGLMSVTGEPGRGPMRVGVAISDTSAGMFLDKEFSLLCYIVKEPVKDSGCTLRCLSR